VTRPFPHMTTRTLSIDESPHTIAARTDDDREEAKRSEAKHPPRRRWKTRNVSESFLNNNN
jgi:hypothetical protein